MDKQSGVYLTIDDQSFQTGGASLLRVIVPMLTTKGELGMNYVTAETFKDILGYDLDYNSNYYGLAKILEKVSYAYVWRLNQGAKMANAYFLSTSSDKESSDDCETFEDITMLDPAPIFAAANTTVGNAGTTAIKFTPLPISSSVPNEGASPSTPQTIVVEDVSPREEKELYGKTIKNGCVIYDSVGESVIAIIMPNYDDELRVYKVVDGEIVDDVITTDLYNIWTDGTKFYNALMQETIEPQGEPGTPNVIGTVRNTNYNVSTNVWEVGDKSYNEDLGEITPEGTKGSTTALADVYIADGTETYLSPAHWYGTTDAGTTFYEIRKLNTTWDSSQIVEITNADVNTELANLYAGSKFTQLDYCVYTHSVETGMYQQNMDVWRKVISLSSTMIVVNPTPETNTDIITALENASDITISHIVYTYEYVSQVNAIGTAEWDSENNLTMELVAQPSKESYFTIERIPVEIKEWTVNIADYADNQYRIKKSVEVSTNPESEIYWKNIDFGDVQIFIDGNISSNWDAIRDYITLDNGSNGDNNIIASEIDLTPLETSPCNIIAMNGITNYKVANKIAAKAKDYFMHTFVDVPAFKSYADAENWKKNVYANEYVAIGGRPDEVEIAEDKYIYVYPSVSYIAIFADMLSNYGYLCYPPAGATYGNISVEKLMECDYEKFGTELKTNRINWQRSTNNGTMMWEQRTNYALNTDLSYIAPVFIVDQIREQIVTFEQQFVFRYATPTDLLNQESGLTKILTDLQTKNFVYAFKINMPTFAEAQKAGRTLIIPIEVAIMKDSEVIEINVALVNA